MVQRYLPVENGGYLQQAGEKVIIGLAGGFHFRRFLMKMPNAFSFKQRLNYSFQTRFHGSGDYTKERKNWPEKDFDTVVEGILEKRKESIDE